MTPKEKAQQLVDKYYPYVLETKLTIEFKLEHVKLLNAKQCALISVNELFNEIDDNYDTLHSSDRKQYWLQVSKEIINL